MKSGSARKLSFHQRVLRQARKFLLFGFLVIPLLPRRKSPRLRKWTDLRLEVEDLEDAFGAKTTLDAS